MGIARYGLEYGPVVKSSEGAKIEATATLTSELQNGMATGKIASYV